MSRKTELRRSRSWRDLSSFMSKKMFTPEPGTPDVPIHRTSSLNRGSGKKIVRKTRLFHDYDVVHHEDTVPWERQAPLQRQISTSRNATNKKPSPTSRQQPPASQLPAVAFWPKQPTTKPVSRSHGRNASTGTAHSHKASEMSIPLVLDFDLGNPTSSGFDFGFISPPVIERDLTPEEKASLISAAQPMHIVDFPSHKPPTKQNSLKRLFSLRSKDKSSPASSKRNSPQEMSARLEVSSKSIYRRPPPITSRRPPTPPSSPGSAPPRLTVQIPDSTFDRASKIFQSIYAAHAVAQETVKEQWGIPTPVSASSSTSRVIFDATDIRHVKNQPEEVMMTFCAEGRSVPKGKWSVTSNFEMRGKDRLWGEYDRNAVNRSPPGALKKPELPPVKEVSPTTNTTTTKTTFPVAKPPLPSGVVQVPVAGTRGRISAFPLPIKSVTPLVIYESTDEYDSSDDEDFKDSEDEWDDEDETTDETSVGEPGEPAWEMLTPAVRVRRDGL